MPYVHTCMHSHSMYIQWQHIITNTQMLQMFEQSSRTYSPQILEQSSWAYPPSACGLFDYYSAGGALPVIADPSTPYEYEQ